MARYTGSSCRLCRREGMKLFLKGERCMSTKCAVERRQYPPGEHGQRMRRRPTEYGLQLREKQKVKRIYGIIYRSGLAPSRDAARQMVTHGHLNVNGKIVSIPSYSLRVGDAVTARESIKEVAKANLDRRGGDTVPWIEVSPDQLSATLVDLPSRESIPIPIQEQLIVELYSK
jgi:small subunit ribosomal protein S4